MSTSSAVSDQNALSGLRDDTSRLYVKALVLKATDSTYETLIQLPETAPWADKVDRTNTYVVIIEAMIGQKKYQRDLY